MEILVTVGLISYIIYLRYYADLRTEWEKDTERLKEGIDRLEQQRTDEAFAYFDGLIRQGSRSGIAYLYRARCYRVLGKPEAALKDLKTGESFDGSIPDLHLEIGRHYFDQGDFPAALQAFDKAVFYSHGELPGPYRWRGLTRQQLREEEAARQDLQKAESIAGRNDTGRPSRQYSTRAFFDRRLLLWAIVTALNGLVILYITRVTSSIHWPYLYTAVTGALIGYVEPRRGWVLAVLQASILWFGYTYFSPPPTTTTRQELELFALYGSLGLTFVASFIGGALKRQLR